MAGEDNRTYGFNKQDARALVESIGNGAGKFRQGSPRRGGGGVTFWRFTLNEAWTSGVADADILTMSGTDTGTDADVNDPLGIFSTLTTDDAGICFLQDGVYYVIQAPCP